MFRRHFLRYRLYYCAHIPGLTAVNPHDDPNPTEVFEPKTGFDRVLNLFRLDEHKEIKKEVASAIHLTGYSALCVAMYGGIRYSKTAFENYVDLNQATRYISAYEFKRKLHDHVAVEMGKYFIIYGAKGLAFAGIFSFVTIMVAAFRDKDAILEYVIGASLAGSLVRINHGLKGMFAAGFLGSLLGAALGTLIWVTTKIGNVSIQDIRQMSYDYRTHRKELVNSALKKAQEDDDLNRITGYYEKALIKKNNPDDEDKIFVLVGGSANAAGGENSDVSAAVVTNESKS